MIAPFITLLLTPLEEKLVDYSVRNQSVNFFRNRFFGHLAQKFIKLTFHKEIETLFVEHIIDQFLLTMCQKKRIQLGHDIVKDFLSK